MDPCFVVKVAKKIFDSRLENQALLEFAHPILLTGFGEYFCIYEKKLVLSALLKKKMMLHANQTQEIVTVETLEFSVSFSTFCMSSL